MTSNKTKNECYPGAVSAKVQQEDSTWTVLNGYMAFLIFRSLLLGVKAKTRERQDIANVGHYTSIWERLW